MFRRGQAEDLQQGDGVRGRLDEAAGCRRARRQWAGLGAGPPFGPRKIIAGLRIEDDVRQATITPLSREQRLQLAQGTIQVDVRQTDTDEGAVPTPLVWIKSRRGSGPITQVVALEDRESAALKGFCR
jgi:hypothetical protein